MRSSGILMPISSLPSPYGIGAFDKSAYQFVDFLSKAGQKYWQILPLGPTGYGDSPYQSFSTFAGNPYFIDLEQLIKKGLLTKEECDQVDFGTEESYIDYEKIYLGRFPLLKKAFERSNIEADLEFNAFMKDHEHWLNDYSLYMAVKDYYGGKSFVEWDEDIKLRNPKALAEWEEKLHEEVLFYCFIQFEFYEQWSKLKNYANKNGIKIIGDIPIYVAYDGADSWSHPELFQFNENCEPIAVAGCPPDAFSETGQLWGNPLYDWDYHEKTGYSWWIKRIAHCFQIYDTVRIDHFRGFDEYYSIPYGEETAEFGCWRKGPGIKIFNAIKEALGEVDIIAEDLGFLTESVEQLLKDTGYPGMKILQFAFDSREESDYLPHNYPKNCVVYTGTHDNDTLAGWYGSIPESDKKMANNYANIRSIEMQEICNDFICLAMRSVANICIIPMQDYLNVGSEGRINTPSTLGENWKYRVDENAITQELSSKIRKITKVFCRC